VASGPQIKDEPQEAALFGYLRELAAAGVRSVQITGGEPMLREKLVLRLLRECRKLGLSSVLTTNGFWGATVRDARRRVKALRRNGLDLLTVSYDRYHAAFQDHRPVLNIARAAEELNFSINISIVRLTEDQEIAELISPFEKLKNVRLRFYDVQPVGRARQFPRESLRQQAEGFCNACCYPAITDDGRLTACNGPSYFAGPDSPLHLGSLREVPLNTLLERHWNDPILSTIRTFGPSRLRDELKRIPGFEAFPFRESYSGMCDLCTQITSNSEAVAALRKQLVEPELEAERQAAWRVIDGSRKGGSLSRDYVNGIGACRLFFRKIWRRGAQGSREAEQILGRPDLDWNHLAAYLTGCGLARPLLETLKDPDLTPWAPSFFCERLSAGAIHDGIHELIQRETIRRIGAALGEIGGRGTLLKGSALLCLEKEGLPLRATGDVDIHVDAPLASVLRRKLLEKGFTGVAGAPRSAPHHLAPISFQGIPVEIHERIMPSFWGLPEQDMLAHARAVDGENLFALDGEGLLLHAGIHASTHLFAYGLKTAWDILWVLQHFPDLDWDRLVHWVGSCRLARGFWVPVRVLSHELEIPFPNEFLRRAPADRLQQKLEMVARHRLFNAMEGAFDLNPITKNGVFLLLHDSWIGGAQYLLSLAGGNAAEARHTAQSAVASQSFTQLPRQCREAIFHWRSYRRALANQARRI